MKLDDDQQRRVEEQLSWEAISEEHPVIPKLKEAFGDHTFFLNPEGLNVVEKDPSSASSSSAAIKLASWNDDHTALELHEPQLMEVTLDLGPGGSDSAG